MTPPQDQKASDERAATNLTHKEAIPLIVVFVVLLGWYFLAHWEEPGFVSGVMGNVIATVIGVAVGVPIALWLNDLAHRTEQQVRAHELAVERRQRKDKILLLLKDELQHNSDYLIACQPQEGRDNYDRRAFSDGGEVEWIDDPTLLASIAHAYYHITAVKTVEHDLRVSANDTLLSFTLIQSGELRAADQAAIEAINAAIRAIHANASAEETPRAPRSKS